MEIVIVTRFSETAVTIAFTCKSTFNNVNCGNWSVYAFDLDPLYDASAKL